MSDVLLRDLVEIPDEVHAGDFVLSLAKGVGQQSTVADYVVTEPLAGNFDKALGLIKSALEQGKSSAAYLDGSFGSGKSHFMAILYAILQGDPEARGKRKLADVVARHDTWLAGRKFLLVPYHLPESKSLDSAILGGYVAHVSRLHQDKPLPAVYRDDELLQDAKEQRQGLGDDAFIAQLPAAADDEWGTAGWDPRSLDDAFSEAPGGPERRRLIGDLLAGPFRRYSRAVRADEESYISLDEGLSVISKHAKDVLGYDAVVLLLDELVLWLAGYIGDPTKVSLEAQKVSKLVESAYFERPAPVVSFVPRQRDLRDLVSKAAAGNEVTSLFDTLKYWDGRFDSIRLADTNLPAIVHERLLKPKSAEAASTLKEAFASTRISPQEWEVLLDTHGERGTREAFELTYPFSPAFVHAMVDISGALQRERTALKLMQQLLVDYRDLLPVGQLMPLGAIFDVLASGDDRPFTDKLRDEFETTRNFYNTKVRPFLLDKHGLTEEQAKTLGPRHAFRGDDLVVKTLLLATLVPNVPALKDLTASRLAALNHGSVKSKIPNQERAQVTRTLKGLSAEFGEIRLSGSEDDPRVDLHLIGVDTDGIIRDNRHADGDAERRKLVRGLLWKELGLTDDGGFDTRKEIIWRGTARTVEVLMDNVCDHVRMPVRRFQPDPGTIRMIIDYPFDVGNRFPADDIRRVGEVQAEVGDADTIIWLPHFLSEDRIGDLSTLIVINYLLERDRLAEATPTLTADDRHHARTQLESRQSALTARVTEALRRAYGVSSADDADLGPRSDEQVMTLARDLRLSLQIGQAFGDAFQRLNDLLLAHRFPHHPDFNGPNARRQLLQVRELEAVADAIDHAAQDTVGRYEPPKQHIPILKKIANPLKLGVMHEAAFVLLREWPDALDRKAAGQQQVTVGQLRGWIEEQQPGLPVSVQNLLVTAYAIQTDKAWVRAGKPTGEPGLAAITDDMALRSQELPSEEEFGKATQRANGIFGIAKQPVRNARSVQVLASAIRTQAEERKQAAQDLASELGRHQATLGLEPDGEGDRPRMATSKILTSLLPRLAATTDPTETLRVLAGADLPRDNAFYKAHLKTAGEITGTLRTLKWDFLDQFAAAENDADAFRIVSRLQEAARHDEHEVALAKQLHEAEKAAIELAMSRMRMPGGDPPVADPPVAGPPIVVPPVADPPVVPGRHVEQVGAEQVPNLANRLCDLAAEHPGKKFEISWRIVED
ncbi:MAG: phage resistance protein [Nocardiopsaceae bacterium]|nr:phage resistance protein [Nocardiopsaceae bacterium]